MILIGLAAVFAFGRRAGRFWEGLLALGALVFSIRRTDAVRLPVAASVLQRCMHDGLAHRLAARRRRGAADEAWARIGCTALLGATYFNSGISKLVYGGSTWLSGLPVQAAIVGQSGMVTRDSPTPTDHGWWRPRSGEPPLHATVAFELSGPLMLVGRRLRLCVALGLVAMHANIYFLTMHILYWQSMVLLLAVALSPDPTPLRVHRRPRDFWPMIAGIASRRRLAVCASVAIAHQAVRFACRHAVTADVAGDDSRTDHRPSGSVGPFAVGQNLALGWSIESLQPSEQGVMLILAGEPGRVRFELTCRSSPRARSMSATRTSCTGATRSFRSWTRPVAPFRKRLPRHGRA